MTARDIVLKGLFVSGKRTSHIDILAPVLVALLALAGANVLYETGVIPASPIRELVAALIGTVIVWFLIFVKTHLRCKRKPKLIRDRCDGSSRQRTARCTSGERTG